MNGSIISPRLSLKKFKWKICKIHTYVIFFIYLETQDVLMNISFFYTFTFVTEIRECIVLLCVYNIGTISSLKK